MLTNAYGVAAIEHLFHDCRSDNHQEPVWCGKAVELLLQLRSLSVSDTKFALQQLKTDCADQRSDHHDHSPEKVKPPKRLYAKAFEP